MNFLLDFKILHNKHRQEYKSSVDDEHNNNDTSPQMYISYEKFTLVSHQWCILFYFSHLIERSTLVHMHEYTPPTICYLIARHRGQQKFLVTIKK